MFPKKILLCVCGSIATYKSLEIIRLLQDKGIQVQVAMSKASQKLVTSLSFETISQKPVLVSTFQSYHQKIDHIEASQNVDAILVAPATANIFAKYAYGMGDSLISTLLLAAKAPIFFAPAMNEAMWGKKVVQENIKKTQKSNAWVIPPDAGLLACGSYGMGKMASPENITHFVLEKLRPSSNALQKKKALVIAGTTREYLDPFRFISNGSSGKMGLEIAKSLSQQSASVSMICGDVKVAIEPHFETSFARTTKEMEEKVLQEFSAYDIVVMCAAVCDYQVSKISSQKIKEKDLQLVLTKTPDILQKIGKRKKKNQVLVGFAAETENLESYALQKLKEKNLDIIFANKIGEKDSGFEQENSTYQILVQKGNKIEKSTLKKDTKAQASQDLVEKIKEVLQSR